MSRTEHELAILSISWERVRKAHEGRITTDEPNLCWATDGAKIWTVNDGWLWVFTAIEHWIA